MSPNRGMASKGQHSQTPYKALKENPSCYIDPEHLPAHINLANPHSMKREEIVSFFEHIIQRQQILDPPNVFRFKTVKIIRKGTPILEDMDADKSTNDEGDQDVNIGANMLPPPPCPCPKPKRKAQNNPTADQDADILPTPPDIGANVLPPPPHPCPKPKRKALNNLTANQDWLGADGTPPSGNIITDDLINPVLWEQSQKQQTHIQAQISMNS